MDEKTFLDEAGLVVTTSRIELGGQTFATRNVVSVKVAGKNRPVAGVLIAALGAGTVAFNPFMGVPLLALGGYLLWQAFTQRSLVLNAGGGEMVALKGSAKQMETIRAAVAQAIASR